MTSTSIINSQDLYRNPTPGPSTDRRDSCLFLISANDTQSVHPNKSGSTPHKDDISKVLGVTVPSPFKKCLFWPDASTSTKKTARRKEKIPSAVTSQAWRQYYEKKDAEKKKALEDKELRAKKRLEKKILREKLAAERKSKVKPKKKKVLVNSSSEDTDVEINYDESGESAMEEQTDSNEEDLLESEKQSTGEPETILRESGKRKISIERVNMDEKRKRDLTKGSFVIVNYEGEYFPGVVENKSQGLYEISTMTLSTGNSFKWPDRPDKIWYQSKDIIEIINPPVRQNNRGFYKVADMEKYLPDIYLI